MRRLILATATLSGALLLSGCFWAQGSRLMCPPIVEYSDAFQDRAAKELDDAEKADVPQPYVNRLLDDYHELRQAAKACR
jgi:hypothetical protein